MATTAVFEALGSITGAIAAASLLFIAALGVGGLFVRFFARAAWRATDLFLVRLAAGLSLLGAVGAILGAAKCLSGNRSLWLLGGFALLNLLDLLPANRPRLRLRIRIPRVAWLALPIVLVTLGPALAYPTGWDELVYHHELPRRWLADGWPAFYADLPYSGFPSLGEILFWLFAPIENVIAPRLLNWMCWLLGLALVYRLLRRYLAMDAALVVTATFAMSETVLMISANCYVESILMLNVAAILYAIPSARASTGRMPVPPIVLGVLAGGAAGVKLTGTALIAIPCFWLVGYVLPVRGRMAKSAHSLALFL